jgi:hypothetical protein
MVKLMDSNITNERFVLVAENWDYKNFLQALSKAVKATPPKKLAPPYMLNIIWRLDWLKNKLTGKRRQLTRHLSKSLTSKKNYSSDKIKTALNHELKLLTKPLTL